MSDGRGAAGAPAAVVLSGEAREVALAEAQTVQSLARDDTMRARLAELVAGVDEGAVDGESAELLESVLELGLEDKHAFVADALSDTDSIEIFEKGNNHTASGLDFLTKLARGCGAIFRKRLNNDCSHLLEGVAADHNIAVQLDDFLLLDQKSERLRKILILR